MCIVTSMETRGKTCLLTTVVTVTVGNTIEIIYQFCEVTVADAPYLSWRREIGIG